MIVIYQKRYGKKFEDLDRVVDASSSNKETVNGYHVCEAVILGKNEKNHLVYIVKYILVNQRTLLV